MGLDVSVYKNIKVTESEEDYDFTAFVIDESWLYKIKNLEVDKNYLGECTDANVSYSYSTHSRFRCELLNLTGNLKALKEPFEIDWVQLSKNNKVPFYELINFADNEGCLDFEISEKLYAEFIEWEEVAVKYFEDDDYFKGKYLDWLNVFKNGKDKGVVVFH